MNLNPAEKNAFEAMDMLLRTSKVRVTRRTLREKLWQHPDFPSLVSVSDTLEELKVTNMAVNLSPERLTEIPLPALAYVNIDGGMLALIRTITSDTIEWLHTKQGWQKQTVYEFSRIWSGVTLLIEPDQQSGETRYTERRRQEQIENSRYPFIIGCLLICFGLFLSYTFHIATPPSVNWQLYLLMSLKVVGVIISSFLIAYSFDSNNPFLRNICQFSSRTNCNSILNSKAAKLFNWLSWAEVGLMYFTGGFLSIAFVALTPSASTVQAVLWLNLFALPYTLYSLYYQFVVVKEFCVLCLMVQVILWLEFLVGRYLEGFFSIEGVGQLLFFFSLVAAFWAIAKPVLRKAQRADPLHRELQKIKFDGSYINGLLTKQRYIPPLFEGMKVATLGNPNAENNLIMITNLTCEACANIHQEIELVIRNTSELKCQLIFAASNRVNDVGGKVAQHLLSLPEEMIPEALHQWFTMEKKDLKKWRESLNIVSESQSKQELKLHLRWIELAGVTNAPFIFINGAELPRVYSISEVEKLCKSFQSSRI